MRLTIPARYSVDAVPPKTRKPRRLNLHGYVDVEIAELAAGEFESEAVVGEFATYPDRDPNERERIVFMGHAGRVWRPLTIPNEGRLRPITPEEYAAELQDVSRTENDCPFSRCFDRDFGTKQSLASTDVEGIANEADFVGKIEWSNKNETLARYATAQRDVVVAGGAVYVAVRQPVWNVNVGGRISLFEHSRRMFNTEQEFGLDGGLDAARAWCAVRGLPGPNVLGTLERAVPEYLGRDDLGIYLRSKLSDVFRSDRLQDIIARMPPETALDWHELRRLSAFDWRTSYEDVGMEVAPEVVLQRLKSLHDAIAAARVPMSLLGPQEWILKNNFQPLIARAEFELARRPQAGRLDAAEDAAVGALPPA